MDGTELRNRRKAAGLGQRELSKASGIAQKTISAVENGRVRLSRGVARKLDQALEK